MLSVVWQVAIDAPAKKDDKKKGKDAPAVAGNDFQQLVLKYFPVSGTLKLQQAIAR